MCKQSRIREAIDVVLESDLSDAAFGNAVIARAEALAGRPRD